MTNYLQTRKLRLRKIKLLRKIKVIWSDGGELKFEAGGSASDRARSHCHRIPPLVTWYLGR